MREVRGAEIALIFQEPMTALNPVFTVGDQIAEALLVHKRASRREARGRAVELLDAVGVPDAANRAARLPASAVRRHAAARADRGGARLQAVAAHRRRADDRARRHHSGADPRPAARDENGVQPVAAAHHPRSRHHRRNRGSRRRDVRRAASSRKARSATSFTIRRIRIRAGCSHRWRRAPLASGCGRSKARCRCSARCRRAVRSIRAAPTDSRPAAATPPSDYPVGPDHRARCYLHDPVLGQSMSRPSIVLNRGASGVAGPSKGDGAR